MSQCLDALERANEVRVGRARLKQELATGEISLAGALDDERASTMPVGVLLRAQSRWGPRRVTRLCRGLRVSESRPVGGVTARQRALIADAAGRPGRRVAAGGDRA